MNELIICLPSPNANAQVNKCVPLPSTPERSVLCSIRTLSHIVHTKEKINACIQAKSSVSLCQVNPASPCEYRRVGVRVWPPADGCLLNSREKGIEHAGHTVWVANPVSQAQSWTVSGLPDPWGATQQREGVAEIVEL